MSEPVGAPDPADAQTTAARAEHDAATEAAEEVAGAEASEAIDTAETDDAGHGGHDDGHGGHDAVALGPIDWAQWAAGLVGIAAGALVAVSFALGTAYITV
jgi:hypothetical protein